MFRNLKEIKKKNLVLKLIPQCHVSVPFIYKKRKNKFLICFTLTDGFFGLYILGSLNKINVNGFFLSKIIENIKYKFMFSMPFLLIFNCI